MKIFLAVLGVVVIVISLIADYKWRRWMEERRRTHDQDEYRR